MHASHPVQLSALVNYPNPKGIGIHGSIPQFLLPVR